MWVKCWQTPTCYLKQGKLTISSSSFTWAASHRITELPWAFVQSKRVISVKRGRFIMFLVMAVLLECDVWFTFTSWRQNVGMPNLLLCKLWRVNHKLQLWIHFIMDFRFELTKNLRRRIAGEWGHPPSTDLFFPLRSMGISHLTCYGTCISTNEYISSQAIKINGIVAYLHENSACTYLSCRTCLFPPQQAPLMLLLAPYSQLMYIQLRSSYYRSMQYSSFKSN